MFDRLIRRSFARPPLKVKEKMGKQTDTLAAQVIEPPTIEFRVFIGLGSNLNTPQKQLDQAIKSLSKIPSCSLIAHSSYYSSTPVGPQDQPDFINAAALIKTKLSPNDLLKQLQAIEINQGRVKKRHWGERSIDLDILLYGNLSINSEALCIPHKELANRDFVLRPLLELDENLSLPEGTSLRSLLDICPDNKLQRIES